MGVAWSGDESQFEDFIDKYDLTFPQISDDSGDIFGRFDVASQPAFAIVYPDGRVETLLGSADDELLDSIIEQALA